MEAKHLYGFGSFLLDPAERRLLRDGEPVALTPKCFDLLVMFVDNSGHLLEKGELLERLWPGQFVEEANLSFNVSSLRKALGEGRDGQRFIETVPKKGFRFVARVVDHPGEEAGLEVGNKDPVPPAGNREERGESPTRSAIEAGGSALPIPFAPPSRRRQRLRILFAVLGAGALGLLAYGLRMSRTAAPAVQPHKTIAVLPFKPLSADGADESLELGMADTLITRLSNVRQLVVRPMTAVRKYADPSQDPVKAGRELQTELVLDGSIQKAGDRVRVTVRLMDVESGATLWAEQFDEYFKDIFKVQDSISGRVTNALLLKLSGDEERRLAKRYTNDPEAYQLFLQAGYLVDRMDFQRGLESYQLAIEKDPNFALAYIGLAESVMRRTNQPAPPNPIEAVPIAKAAVTKALELDETLAEAHNALAELKYQFEYDWPGAEKDFQRAIELNPNDAQSHLAYGWFLMSAGRFDEAMPQMERAQELDRSSLFNQYAIAKLYYYMRDYDKALNHFQKIAEVDPNYTGVHYEISAIYQQKGMYAEAFEAWLENGARNPRYVTFTPEEVEKYRETFKKSGWQGIVQARRLRLEERSKRQHVLPSRFAEVCALLGDKDCAFTQLEKGIDERDPNVIRLKIEPQYDSLRSDPRYAKLLEGMNLMP